MSEDTTPTSTESTESTGMEKPSEVKQAIARSRKYALLRQDKEFPEKAEVILDGSGMAIFSSPKQAKAHLSAMDPGTIQEGNYKIINVLEEITVKFEKVTKTVIE